MPTPFQHLNYARAFLKANDFPDAVRAVLTAHPGPFLLGCTAVDVQSITGQPRVETHFYDFPPPITPRAGEVLLSRHPGLGDRQQLSPDQAAFLAGYLNHLAWDEVWAWEIYLPKFLFSGVFPSHRELVLHHNGLRVYLDHQAEAELHTWPELIPWLEGVKSEAWLPFVEDRALHRWRDWLVDQLSGRIPVESAQVFAGRTGLTGEDLERVAGEMATGRYAAPMSGLERALEQYGVRGAVESRAAVLQYLI